MPKKFLCGVADLYYYDNNENIIFQSKTMISNAIEVTIDSTAINAGKGNSKQMVYFHTPDMSVKAEEAQFNLDMIAASVGSSITTGTNIWYEETITLGAGGSGTATKTPVTTNGGATIYGWFTKADDSVVRVTFTGSNFTVAGGVSGDVGCLRYYYTEASARSLTVNSNFIPSVGKLVLDAQLFSGDSVSTSSLVGKILVEIPKALMMGTASLNLTSSGVSNTPIDFTVLSASVAGCTGSGVYAYVKEHIFGSNWYDNVIQIAMTEDPYTLTTATSPHQMVVMAIPQTGSAFQLTGSQLSDLTWTSSDIAKFTVSASGTITKVATGTGLTLTAEITAKNTVKDTASITVA